MSCDWSDNLNTRQNRQVFRSWLKCQTFPNLTHCYHLNDTKITINCTDLRLFCVQNPGFVYIIKSTVLDVFASKFQTSCPYFGHHLKTKKLLTIQTLNMFGSQNTTKSVLEAQIKFTWRWSTKSSKVTLLCSNRTVEKFGLSLSSPPHNEMSTSGRRFLKLKNSLFNSSFLIL